MRLSRKERKLGRIERNGIAQGKRAERLKKAKMKERTYVHEADIDCMGPRLCPMVG